MSSTLSLPAHPAADGASRPVVVTYSVQARAEPGVLPRVVELFAKRGLVPQEWHSTAAGVRLTIDLQIGLDRELGDYIARCMRQITGVETVLTSERRLAT